MVGDLNGLPKVVNYSTTVHWLKMIFIRFQFSLMFVKGNFSFSKYLLGNFYVILTKLFYVQNAILHPYPILSILDNIQQNINQ